MLKPLIRGVSTILKLYVTAEWGEIKRDTKYNKDQDNNIPKALPTWAELMHGLVIAVMK